MTDERDAMGCERIRAAIQQRHDGPVDAALDAMVEAHLADCPACGEFDRGLARVRRALGSLPRRTLPAADLEAVWDRTVRADDRTWWAGARGWRTAAVAAALGGALIALWVFFGRPADDAPALAQRQPATVGVEPSEEELALAAAQVRLVLYRTAAALRQSQRAAVHAVLDEEVSPALRRLPLLDPADDRHRRSGT